MVSAVDLVPIETVKDSLRIERDDTELDALLTDQLEAAVSMVEGHTGLALVTRTENVLVRIPCADEPIILRTTSVALAEPITVTGNGNPVTVTTSNFQNNRLALYPPSTGWPEATSDLQEFLTVTFTRETAVDDMPSGLRHACILMVRNLYDGLREIRPSNAYWVLVDRYRQIV